MSRYAMKVKSQVWELVPPGDHVLRLTGVEDGPTFTNDKTGEPEPTIKLKLEVDRGESRGLGLSALVNPASWGPKSNARRWAEALVGGPVEDDSVFDPEDYLDTLVWAKVIIKPDSKGVDRNVIDTVFSYAALEAQFAGGKGYAGPLPAGEGSARAPTGRRRAARDPGPDQEIVITDDDPILGKDGEEAPF